MALPIPVIPPQPDAFHLAPHRIRRCTFRRLINVESSTDRVYDVECLFPDRKVPIPLGDLETATPICNACVAPHIFRPGRGLSPAERRGADSAARWADAAGLIGTGAGAESQDADLSPCRR